MGSDFALDKTTFILVAGSRFPEDTLAWGGD